MRHSLFTRLLLITALLFAQMGGLAHGITHTLADQGSDQSLPHDKHCDLCATYAQIGAPPRHRPDSPRDEHARDRDR